MLNMRNALSIFFIGTLFTLTVGIGVRYSSQKTNDLAIRSTSSVTENSNCFAMLHIFLDSQQKALGEFLLVQLRP